MKLAKTSKITPYLWFAKDPVGAARFYTSVFPDSSIDRITPLPADSPSGPAGSVQVVDFRIAGQEFVALGGGPLEPFNHAISLVVNCDDQREVDRYWESLGRGGTYEQCGWLKDRFGVYWQITPTILIDMMTDDDHAKAKRVAEQMMKMTKLDIAPLQQAFAGG